eukprot:6080033-Alexandrium_andersonii.AAC.1
MPTTPTHHPSKQTAAVQGQKGSGVAGRRSPEGRPEGHGTKLTPPGNPPMVAAAVTLVRRVATELAAIGNGWNIETKSAACEDMRLALNGVPWDDRGPSMTKPRSRNQLTPTTHVGTDPE